MKLFRALALTLLVSSAALAQNAALMPIPKQQFFTSQGKPLAGGLIYTYAAGTSTPLATYTDATGTTPNTNPVVLDSGGFANIWLGSAAYKIAAQNFAGVPQWTVDNVTNPGASGGVPNGFARLDSNSHVLQAELNYVAADSNNRQISVKLGDAIKSVTADFGAACDGTTDDSVKLQAGVTWAAGNSGTLLIPSGTCAFATTLNMNSGTTGVHLVGRGGIGSGASVLKYTGTGSALLYKNTTGNKFIYNAQIEGVAILASGAATYGIESYILSESYFKNVSIGVTGAGTLQTGFYCGSQSVAFTGCNIVTFQHTVIQSTSSHAVVMINPAAITFRDDDFFQIKGADFALNGAIDNFVVRDGWHETTNIGVLLDDSLSSDNLTVGGLHILANRFLFNGGVATYPDQIVFKLNNTGTKAAVVRNFSFRDNNALFAASLTSTLYPFQFAWSATAGAGSAATGEIADCLLNGMQNTGAFVGMTNGSAATTVVAFRGVQAIDQNNAAFYKEMNGVANYTDIKQFLNSTNIGSNFTKSGATLALMDNDATNGGITRLNVYAGPSQGSNSILNIFDNSSNALFYATPSGWSYTPGLGTIFGNASGTRRWAEITQGTESGSNTGSNWTVNRYTDAGGFIDTPLSVTRSTGQVQMGDGASIGGAVVLPAIHSTTGTRYLCVDTVGNITASASACSGT